MSKIIYFKKDYEKLLPAIIHVDNRETFLTQYENVCNEAMTNVLPAWNTSTAAPNTIL